MLRTLALLLSLVAVACMTAAIAGMVTGRPSGRAGYVVRAVAVLCFAGAVALGAASR